MELFWRPREEYGQIEFVDIKYTHSLECSLLLDWY